MERRVICRSMAGLALSLGIVVGSTLLPLHAIGNDHESEGVKADVGRIYELQAAFHRAKSTQDIDLMMSLWAEDASLTIVGDPNSPYVGLDQLKAFLLTTGSFVHPRFSLVPSFKIQIDVHGDEAFLYFECHDIGDFDLPTRYIASDTYVGGTVRKVNGKWLFWNVTSGKALPLSVNHYYFP
ncbi:MAG TPA: nuclear transport factor 2 family protein [Acidobacteriota bacterium]|nr:nuclear transport factor 2 family protein [Acidobacteriota bacterium]